MTKKKYVGTNGLTPVIATKRLRELFEKYKLNEQDDKYVEESLSLLEEQIEDLVEDAHWFEVVEDLLTATQWKKARKEVMRK